MAGLGLPSASTLSAGSRSMGTLTSKTTSPWFTLAPWAMKILFTVPAAVAFIGTAGSAATVAETTTSLVIVPDAATVVGSTIVPVGTAGDASAGRSGKNASLMSAAATRATRRIRRIGKTHVRAIPMKPPGTEIVVIEHPHPRGALAAATATSTLAREKSSSRMTWAGPSPGAGPADDGCRDPDRSRRWGRGLRCAGLSPRAVPRRAASRDRGVRRWPGARGCGSRRSRSRIRGRAR